MALETINVPAHPSAAPNTRDTTPEAGDSWQSFMVKAKAMFTELYTLVAAAPTDTELDAVEADIAAASLIRSADVTISSAELLALNAVPKTLVAAPGAGLALVFEGAVAFLDYGTVAYDGVAAGEDLAVKYTDGSGLQVGACETDPFLTGTADAMRFIQAYRAASGVSQITPVANSPLVAQLLSGEIATGDSPVKVRTYYRVVPTVL